MEDLDQVLKCFEAITLNENVENSFATNGNRIGKRIRRFFNNVIIQVFGREVQLRRRSYRFLLRLVKMEEVSDLSVQNKIILISKAITFCHETFDFAPRALEKMLVKKVEELRRSVIGQLS